MQNMIHDTIFYSAEATPDAAAVRVSRDSMTYGALADAVVRVSAALRELGLGRGDRVAVFLPKQFESVIGMFGAAHAGAVFVPLNPLLKPAQVAHILRDCNVRVLITQRARAELLRDTLAACPDLRHLVTVDGCKDLDGFATGLDVIDWQSMIAAGAPARPHRVIDADMTAIFYTSGSTGKPKGVVLSHRNMLAGADSVSTYLANTPDDHLLAVLPFSFDYGFSQLSTAFLVGACVTLMDYLLPRDVIRAVAKHGITGLAGVPPLWIQLARLPWPDEAVRSLRYVTNSGGAMPLATVDALRAALPTTEVYLMYGLTEAFRSTFLPPDEIDARPGSMGKAIPNAEVMVVREDGSPCSPDEPGELVHRGALVALGYWNDREKTAARFKPVPHQPGGLVIPETAVWSGDTVRMDEDGYLYFVGRHDEMIKTSGYRVSPAEIEEVAYATGLVSEACALGRPDPDLGQAIVLVVVAAADAGTETKRLRDAMAREVPAYMNPAEVVWQTSLPRNPNGKLDRKSIAQAFARAPGEQAG